MFKKKEIFLGFMWAFCAFLVCPVLVVALVKWMNFLQRTFLP